MASCCLILQLVNQQLHSNGELWGCWTGRNNEGLKDRSCLSTTGVAAVVALFDVDMCHIDIRTDTFREGNNSYSLCRDVCHGRLTTRAFLHSETVNNISTFTKTIRLHFLLTTTLEPRPGSVQSHELFTEVISHKSQEHRMKTDFMLQTRATQTRNQ